MAGIPGSTPDGRLPVTCWCEADAKYFASKQIIDGKHGWSCGRTRCTPDAQKRKPHPRKK